MIAFIAVAVISISAPDSSSLIAAIEQANGAGQPIEINLDGGSYPLSDEIAIGGNVTIKGNGSKVFSTERDHRLLSILPGASVTLSDISLSRGNSIEGGLILNRGDLFLEGVELSRGRAWSGGSIYNMGFLRATDTTFYASSNYPVNGIGGNGGHVANHGTVVFNRVFCRKGQARLGRGGCLANSGNAVIVNSTIYGNRARLGNCGGIVNYGTMTINNSTISRNQANGGNEPYKALSTGGLCAMGGRTEVSNTIFEGNFDAQHGARGIWNCSGDIVPLGGSVDTSNACESEKFYVDIKLDGPKYNGGLVKTMAIGIDSPAYMSGSAPLCEDMDARGVARRDQCDAGAYEHP